MQTGRFTIILALAFGAIACIPIAHAQQTQQPAQADSGSQATPGQDAQNPLTRQLSDKERFKQQKDLKQELHGTYKTWLDVILAGLSPTRRGRLSRV